MTLVEIRQGPASRFDDPLDDRSFAAPWRFAARLARREVRRRPGRTALIVVLVAVPVLAMTLASSTARTVNDGWSSAFARRYGAADLAIGTAADSTVASDAIDGLPPGSATVSYLEVQTMVTPADAQPLTESVRVTDLDLSEPLADGIVDVTAGERPGPGEVLLSRGLADDLGVDIGDRLVLERPDVAWTVSGIGRAAAEHRRTLMVVGDLDPTLLAPGWAYERTLVDLPAGNEAWWPAGSQPGYPWVDTADRSFEVESRAIPSSWSSDGEVEPIAFAWGWVGGALALAAVGIVIAAAFATSARRQLVVVGQLSANGAPSGLIRRSLAMQGSWSGALGAAVGVVVGIVAAVALHPVVERLAGRAVGSTVIAPIDLVVIVLTGIVAATLAALVPAKSASRIPVLAALAGRRPLATPPTWLVPVGVLTFLAGLGLLLVAATGTRNSADGSGGGGDLFAFVAVLGGLGVLGGMCCATPLVVDAVGRVGGRLRGTWRLAARSVARARGRSAGVVTAVGTAGAFAVAGATFAGIVVADMTGPDDGSTSTYLPRDVVLVKNWQDTSALVEVRPDGSEIRDPGPLVELDRPEAIDARLGELFPDASQFALRQVTFDAAVLDDTEFNEVPLDTIEIWSPEGAPMIADEGLLDLMAVSERDRATLASAGTIAWMSFDGVAETGESTDSDSPPPMVTEFRTSDGPVRVATPIAQDAPRFHAGVSALITESTALELGLDVVTIGTTFDVGSELDREQRRAVADISRDLGWWGGDAWAAGGDAAGSTSSGWYVDYEYVQDPPPTLLINLAIVGAALVLTLLVVAIGLSLSATESRDERDVLVAVGAKPTTLRRLAGAKALVMATAGIVIAIPTGFAPMYVIFDALGEVDDIRFPWLTVAALAAVVPAAAGLAAWSGSALAQRLRPHHPLDLSA